MEYEASIECSATERFFPWAQQDVFYSTLGKEPIGFMVLRSFGWVRDHQEIE